MDKKSLQNLRKDYTKKEFSLKKAVDDPLVQFKTWFQEAIDSDALEPNAMTLSTATTGGIPSSRVVLLKGVDEGFVFYTNYESKKGMQLAENPHACLNFFWPELERQVRVEGLIAKVSSQESDQYFNSRPFKSRIGAHASPQSQRIEKRDVLKNIAEELLKRFTGGSVPRPEHWGGYRLMPSYLEFWQGRASRLHDRICYEQVNNRWEKYRVAP